MSVDIEALLALPVEEKKVVAEKLWESLTPENTLLEEDENVLRLLDQRWEEIQQNDSKVLSSPELKKMINDFRIKKA